MPESKYSLQLLFIDDRNDNRVVRNGLRDRDSSFDYDIIFAIMYLWYKEERVSSGECSNITVRKDHLQEILKHLRTAI